MAILIDNFSINVGEWQEVTETTDYAVDVIDYDYTISTSGTYFMIDGQVVSADFSSISDGYRISCSIPTISGMHTVTIHSSNSNLDILEVDFNLLFGYHIIYEEYVDWGPNKEIIISAEARNNTLCSNKELYITYFKTKDLESINLNARISPIEGTDLQASIRPQSKHLLPGNTYQVRVAGIKDFAGNVLPEFTFSFTIKNT